MAFVTLEDFEGSTEIIVFSDLYEKRHDAITTESMVMVSGKVSAREDEQPKIVADKIELLDKVADGGELILKLFIDLNGDSLENLEEILSEYSGSAEVILIVNTGSERIVMKAEKLKASAKPELTRRLSALLGGDHVKWETKLSTNASGTSH
jgi:DNA polymerase-3 subunit alpha